MATVHDDNVTVIGESVTIRGNLSGDEDLHVLGRVEGTLELSRTLVVAESGIVRAEVSVKNAVVSGIVVGNIRASDSVELTRDGRMVGDITAPRVILVDGASFRGNIDMGDIANMPARPPRSERPAPRPVTRPASRSEPRPEPRAAREAPREADEAKSAEAAAPAAAGDATDVMERPAPAKKTVVTAPPPLPGKNKPKFLDPPMAKGLPKKGKKRVVVKRK